MTKAVSYRDICFIKAVILVALFTKFSVAWLNYRPPPTIRTRCDTGIRSSICIIHCIEENKPVEKVTLDIKGNI